MDFTKYDGTLWFENVEAPSTIKTIQFRGGDAPASELVIEFEEKKTVYTATLHPKGTDEYSGTYTYEEDGKQRKDRVQLTVYRNTQELFMYGTWNEGGEVLRMYCRCHKVTNNEQHD